MGHCSAIVSAFLCHYSQTFFVQAAKGSSSSSYGSATLDKKDAAMAITQPTCMKRKDPIENLSSMVMYLCDVNPIIHIYKINKSTTENNHAHLCSMHIFDSSCYTRVMRGGAMSPSDLGTRARQMLCCSYSLLVQCPCAVLPLSVLASVTVDVQTCSCP